MTLHRLVWVQTYPVVVFYLLAFAISWTGWLPSLLATGGLSFFGKPGWLVFLLLPALGPTVAATLTRDWQGYARVPLPGLFRWQVAFWWYLIAVGLPCFVVWAANILSQWLQPAITAVPVPGKRLALFFLLSLLVNPWEEIGWRGFALRRLQVRYSAFTASLLVGILWGVWHLPLFVIGSGPMSMASVPFLPWFIGILSWSFVMSWLFNHTAGNLLVCSLCHVAGNGFGALSGINSY